MQVTNREIEIHTVVIEGLWGNFQLKTEVKKVNPSVLLNLENPGYKDMVAKYDHFKGLTMDDTYVKKELPVHLILGTSQYAQIKTETTPKIGKPGEPIAELMRLGWTNMSPGSEPDLTNMFLTQTSAVDYEALCRLDVLGLQDQPVGDEDLVYEEFKKQLVRSPEGWYETGLLWKGNHSLLPDNKHGSLRRLQNLGRKLEKQPGMLEKYDAIIQDQLSQGIVERVHSEPQGKVFYILSFGKWQRARRSELSTMRLRELTRKHHPLTIARDGSNFTEQTLERTHPKPVREGWGRVIDQHLNNMQHIYPNEVEEIGQSLYVDDLIGRERIVADANITVHFQSRKI